MKTMKRDILDTALEKGLEGVGLTGAEAAELAGPGHSPFRSDDRLYDLLAVTEKVRRRHKGVEVNLCSIVSAKTGLCREDCSFCSQSVKYSTGVEPNPMLRADEIVEKARQAERNGAREFSIVTSGTKIEKASDVDSLAASLERMRESTGLERCASLGILSAEVLKRLKESGLESYHHNLETSRSFFPKVCTTHEYDDDVEVIRQAKALGFYVCSGGIFGLGESWADRVELVSTLKDLGVDSVPVNFLNPRPGTPLEDASNLTPRECLRIIALIRLMMPTRDIVVCGGRQVNLRDLQPLIFAAGANGMMVGDYLTTPGRETGDDLRMISDLGLVPRRSPHHGRPGGEGGC